jgi:vibriolysin
MSQDAMWSQRSALAFIVVTLTACGGGGHDPAQVASSDSRAATTPLEFEVLQADVDGFPTFIRGRLGKVGAHSGDRDSAEAALRPALGQALRPFHLTGNDLTVRKVNTDLRGNRHYRCQQVFHGLDVIGGELVVHVDDKGEIFAINGTARGDIPTTLGDRDLSATGALDRIAGDSRFAGMRSSRPRQVYVLVADGAVHRAYETIVEGERASDPVRDKVYVSVDTGEIVAVHPQIFFSKNRRIYSLNHGTALPGTLKRTEGQAATTDTAVNGAYDAIGDAYDAYKSFWNRDSYDNAGSVLIGSVHYSTNYCNMFWDGTQLVYGDGDPAQDCLSPAGAIDVTGHELTHAVTEVESGLVYSGEAGGLNEAISDIFGAFTQAWVEGGRTGVLAISADTWMLGEDFLPPALRYMNDPALDGASRDFWTTTAGNVDVHYSSGIANLAFYLMSQGGVHPRGKSTVHVNGIGMAKAIRVFYESNVNILTSSSNFLAARNAGIQAAMSLGFTQAERDSVQNAWAAVGVGTPAAGAPAVPALGNATWVLGLCLAGAAFVTLGRRAHLRGGEGRAKVAKSVKGLVPMDVTP